MEKLLRQLIERVDLLIRIQVLVGLKDLNQSEKIMRLHAVGISQSDIASVLGIKLNSVTSTVSQKRKQKQVKKKQKGLGDDE